MAVVTKKCYYSNTSKAILFEFYSRTKDFLRIHKKKDHNVDHKFRPHRCLICHRSYEYVASLKLHVKIVHENMKEIKCETCNNKIFQTEQSFLAHYKKFHVNKCPECEENFETGNLLNVHIKNAHEVRKFHKCKNCDIYFLHENLLKSHMLG